MHGYNMVEAQIIIPGISDGGITGTNYWPG